MSEEERPPEIDETDAKIAYAKFAGLPPVQVAKVVGVTLPTVRQRLKVKAAFYTEFARYAATIRARFHTVGGDDESNPDVWQDGAYLAQQADEQRESETMLPQGRA